MTTRTLPVRPARARPERGANGRNANRRGHLRNRSDAGVSMIEFAGYLPVLLVIGLAAIQLGLIGYGVNQAGTAARAAARVASQQGGDGTGAGIAAVSGWLDPAPSVQRGADTTTASVTVHVPAVIPLFDDFDLTRTATMPTDD